MREGVNLSADKRAGKCDGRPANDTTGHNHSPITPVAEITKYW